MKKEQLIISVEQLVEWKELLKTDDKQTVIEQIDDALKMAE